MTRRNKMSKSNISWWTKVITFFKPLPPEELNPPKKVPEEETVVVRARNKKGRYVADDPNTPYINEAYVTVKRKKKKKRNKK